jgi:YD repeat-containing protein
MNKQKPEITNIESGRLSETVYVTVLTSTDEEIEFTRHTYEEYGHVVEHELTIEDDEQQEIFDNLSEEEQDEIETIVREAESND